MGAVPVAVEEDPAVLEGSPGSGSGSGSSAAPFPVLDMEEEEEAMVEGVRTRRRALISNGSRTHALITTRREHGVERLSTP